ncbi:response regulator [bacterium]|nr:response regulator [bacterium]
MAKGTASSGGPEGGRFKQGPQPGSLTRVLLVDDNDRYAKSLTEDLHRRGVEDIVRAVNAKEGVELLRARGDEFDGVVSDISMEHQISGLRVLRVARALDKQRRATVIARTDDPRQQSLRGHQAQDESTTLRPLMVACATTGLDTPAGYQFNKFLLGTLYRCDFLIPKRPIKRDGKVFWIRGAKVW